MAIVVVRYKMLSFLERTEKVIVANTIFFVKQFCSTNVTTALLVFFRRKKVYSERYNSDIIKTPSLIFLTDCTRCLIDTKRFLDPSTISRTINGKLCWTVATSEIKNDLNQEYMFECTKPQSILCEIFEEYYQF